jgi:hypothetical protein
MLSLYDDPFILFLFSSCRESFYLWQVKLKWIASTTKQVMMDGLVATLSSIPGHILALGQEASGRLPDLVSTLGSVSGFTLALG